MTTIDPAPVWTATFIKDKDGAGTGKIYKVDPPMDYEEYDEEKHEYATKKAEYVWVSAVVAMFTGPETYIFACDKDGEIISWSEMAGSYRGGLSHERALENAGYVVIDK